jgi:long-chain acyl-CoA synthetase
VNFASVIEGHPAERPALLGEGEVTTYGELRDRVAAMRGALCDWGVEPGDRVVVVAANDREFVASYLAVLGVGALAVPLNPASPPPEVQRELDVIGARLAVVDPAGRQALDGLGPGALPVRAADELAEGPPAGVVHREPSDPAALLFTSGTVGAPRAAVLTHGNLAANVEQVLAAPGRAVGPDAVALGAIPLFHVFGLNALLGVVLYAGASLVLVERFDPRAAVAVIAEHGVTIVSGPPALWSALADLPGVEPSALSGVQLALSGAAPLDPEIRRRVAERLGLDLREGYGLTEASPVVTSGVALDAPEGSIGVPLPGVHVRLVDAHGEDVLVGDPGEIWVRGPNVFAGYWGDPEATVAALTDDGWLRTGDVAVVDDDGFLYLVDRAKDLIIVSGFNVFPAEVEAVICEHPGVADAAVVGVSHPRSGEAVRAFVVPRDGVDLDQDTIVEFCGRYLARYKCPSSVEVVDEVPHGLAGKVLRRELR